MTALGITPKDRRFIQYIRRDMKMKDKKSKNEGKVEIGRTYHLNGNN